jgi:RNA polymerase sigma-70 factor (ECF subfamily)
VTRNACLNHLSRYRSRWRFFSELGRGGDRDSRATDELALVATNSPAVDVELEDRRDHVTRALHRLPDHQRVPLALFHFEEMSYQEIAATLGVSVGKVKTDIHRGRETLRGLLSDHAPR